MKQHARFFVFLLTCAVTLTACSGAAAITLDASDIQATVDTVLTANAPTATTAGPESTQAAGPSFEATTYRDETAGYAFDHPVDWTVGPVEQHSRGGITAFTSWERTADVLPDATPAGETRMDVVVQLWDPKGDLEAFVAQRSLAWDASGIAATLQEKWSSGGRPTGRGLLDRRVRRRPGLRLLHDPGR